LGRIFIDDYQQTKLKRHLYRQFRDGGMFLRRSDDDITINTKEGEATYPIRQVLLSVSPGFIENELGTDY
jgi:hypothetical protein